MGTTPSTHETQSVTPLDVLRNHFGDLPTEVALSELSLSKIEEIGDLLMQSAEASLGDPVPPATYYPGGWLGAGWGDPIFRPEVDLALLYYPRLLVHDPLADFFFSDPGSLPKMREIRTLRPSSGSHIGALYSGPDLYAQTNVFSNLKDHHPEAARTWFRTIVRNVIAFGPLVDAGILILRSQWPTILSRQENLMSSVRHDVRTPAMQLAAKEAGLSSPPTTKWDNIRGLDVMPAGAKIRPADEPWMKQDEFFYLAKTLAIADQAGSTYVPPTDADFALLRAKLITAAQSLRGLEQQPSELLREVARLVVPDFDLDPKTAVSLRKDEESFDSWRRSLSTLARDSKDDDPDTLSERVKDTLIPRINEINRSTKRSKPLRDNLIPDGAAVAVAAGIGFMAGGPGGAAIGAASGVVGWLFKAYQRPSLSESDTVLARIIRK